MRSTELKKMVDDFLSKGGTITKVPRGKSGLYDEYGVPLAAKGGAIGVETRQRLARIRELVRADVSRAEIAEKVGMTPKALDQLVRRWGGWGYVE